MLVPMEAASRIFARREFSSPMAADYRRRGCEGGCKPKNSGGWVSSSDTFPGVIEQAALADIP